MIGMGKPTRNSVILGQVVLGYIRKKAKQPNKQCSSMTSASISASRFLPWILSDRVKSLRWNKPFLHKVALATVFHHRSRNPKTRTHTWGACIRFISSNRVCKGPSEGRLFFKASSKKAVHCWIRLYSIKTSTIY